MKQTTTQQILVLSPVLISLWSFNKVGSSSRRIVAKVFYILAIPFHLSAAVNSTCQIHQTTTKSTGLKHIYQPQGGFYLCPQQIIYALSTTWLSPAIWRGVCYHVLEGTRKEDKVLQDAEGPWWLPKIQIFPCNVIWLLEYKWFPA